MAAFAGTKYVLLNLMHTFHSEVKIAFRIARKELM